MFDFYQPLSSLTHLFGAFFTLLTGAFLIKRGWGNKQRVVSLFVFILGIIFLFSMSGIYHALEPGFARQVFRRLDYSGIFIMIAGTATPIHMILFRGAWRKSMLIFLWSIAIVGLLFTMLFIDLVPQWLMLVIYLSMGWSILISILRATVVFGFKKVALAFIGGVLYTIGAVWDYLEWGDIIPGILSHHEVFHLFVLLGATCHWLLIYYWANQPTHSNLIFIVTKKSDNEILASCIAESLSITATSKENLRKQVQLILEETIHPKLMPNKIGFHFAENLVHS